MLSSVRRNAVEAIQIFFFCPSYTVLSVFKKGDTIQEGSLFKEIRYVKSVVENHSMAILLHTCEGCCEVKTFSIEIKLVNHVDFLYESNYS